MSRFWLDLSVLTSWWMFVGLAIGWMTGAAREVIARYLLGVVTGVAILCGMKAWLEWWLG